MVLTSLTKSTESLHRDVFVQNATLCLQRFTHVTSTIDSYAFVYMYKAIVHIIIYTCLSHSFTRLEREWSERERERECESE